MAGRHAPATERNRAPILHALREILPAAPRVLEIASGTGQHAAWFAEQWSELVWFPSDADPESVASIEAWRQPVRDRVAAPILLDVQADPWPAFTVDAVFCANMIHIAPWSAALALFRGAAAVLPAGGQLILYGPFRRDGAHTAPSNVAFDASLRARDPRWGVRDLETVQTHAAACGLQSGTVMPMPANNLIVVLQKP